MSYQEIITAIDGYGVIVEASAGNYGAYSPALPGCVAGGESFDEVIENMREIIPLHIDALRRAGIPIPIPDPKLESQHQSIDLGSVR